MILVNFRNWVVEENDNTITVEKRIQCRLLELLNSNIIQQAVYNDI